MGQWCTQPRTMAKHMVDFYKDLFSSSGICQPEETLNSIQSLVTDDMNRQLSMEFMD